MKDKKRVYLLGVVSFLVIFTMLLWAGTVIIQGKTTEAVIPGGIAVMILLLMIPLVKRRYFDAKKGYPYEDERTQKIMQKVMSNSYLVTLYWLLAIGFASDKYIHFRDVSQAMSLGVLGMALFFGIFYIYYNRKGDVK